MATLSNHVPDPRLITAYAEHRDSPIHRVNPWTKAGIVGALVLAVTVADTLAPLAALYGATLAVGGFCLLFGLLPFSDTFLAEGVVLLVQGLVGRCDHTHVDGRGGGAVGGDHLAGVEEAEEGLLRRCGKGIHVFEQERAAVRKMQGTRSESRCVHGSEKSLGRGGVLQIRQTHALKWTVGPGTFRVQAAGKAGLPGPPLSREKHWAPAGCCAGHVHQDRAHGVTFGDDRL